MAEILNKLLSVGYYTEDEMQKDVERYLKSISFCRFDNKYPYKHLLNVRFFREVTTPGFRQRSDHIIYFSDRKIINIECKKEGYTTVIEQAKKHLCWADYSLICMPMIYIPNKYKIEMIELGIGMILYMKGVGIYQVINPIYNRNKDVGIRAAMIKKLHSLF